MSATLDLSGVKPNGGRAEAGVPSSLLRLLVCLLLQKHRVKVACESEPAVSIEGLGPLEFFVHQNAHRICAAQEFRVKLRKAAPAYTHPPVPGIDPYAFQVNDLGSIRDDFSLEQQLTAVDPGQSLPLIDAAGAALAESLGVLHERID